MIELVDAAIGAATAGVVAAVAGFIRSRSVKARSDERAQVIAMGEGMGIEYVPGEDFDAYRGRVVIRRDKRSMRLEAARVRDEEGKAG
jgi:hypothetical protein